MKGLLESIAMMVFGLIACLGIGCERGSPHQGATAATDQERKVIEQKISFQLPADVMVLLSEDGGGREMKQAYYRWLFYSRSGFVLTPANVPSPSSHLTNFNVKILAEAIQSLVENELPPGRAASVLSWSDGTYEFRGWLLQTEKGNYLWVERFRKQ